MGGVGVGGLGRTMVDVVFTSEFLLQCLKGRLDISPLRAWSSISSMLLGFGSGLDNCASKVERIEEGVVEEVAIVGVFAIVAFGGRVSICFIGGFQVGGVFTIISRGRIREFRGLVGCVSAFAMGPGGVGLVDVGDLLFLVVGEGYIGRGFEKLFPELGGEVTVND